MEKTVVKALALLELLSGSDQPRGVTELAQELGLTKANVHRLLRTLLQQGYVIQEETLSRYSLSMKLWELGSRSVRRSTLTDVAQPVVRLLCAQANESVQLAVPEELMVIYVDKADSSHPLRATTQIGSRVPAHCVSCGKAMLAFSEVMAARLRFPLARHTPDTLVTQAELQQEFERIRALGYAVNRGEWRPGIWGIAAPIHDAFEEVVASINVWGPQERFDGEATATLGRLVMESAARISQGLGHRPGAGV